MNESASIAFVNGLELAVGLIILVLFFTGPWSEYCIELGRQKLFRLRDEVFLLAADGRIDFDSDAYRLVRDYFNGLIRHTHIINVLTIFFVAVKGSEFSDSSSTADRRLAAIDDKKLRAQLHRKMSAAASIQVGVAFIRSPIGWLFLLFLSPLILLNRLFQGGRGNNWTDRVLSRIKRAMILECRVA